MDRYIAVETRETPFHLHKVGKEHIKKHMPCVGSVGFDPINEINYTVIRVKNNKDGKLIGFLMMKVAGYHEGKIHYDSEEDHIECRYNIEGKLISDGELMNLEWD